MNLLSLTAVELGKKIKAHEVTVEEATRAALDAIRAKEKDINSFVTVDEESAMIRAKEVQKMIDDGTLTGPLAGVPVAIKDNMCTNMCRLCAGCSRAVLPKRWRLRLWRRKNFFVHKCGYILCLMAARCAHSPKG